MCILFIQVLHNYSQPWPQSTDSYTSVHNYCIANDTVDSLKDVQPQNEVKIFKVVLLTGYQVFQVYMAVSVFNSLSVVTRNYYIVVMFL